MQPNELAKATTLLLGPLLTKTDVQRVLRMEDSAFHKVILLDGAANHFSYPWPKTWELVGDADSCSPELKAHFDHLLPRDKDQSDLSYALEHLIPKNTQQLYCKGVTGGRADHDMINLGEVSAFLKRRPEVLVSWGPQLWAYPKGVHSIQYNGGFSLFSFYEQKLDLKGDVQWPLHNQMLFPGSSLTLSNRGHGSFELKCQAPTFFYQIDEDSL